MPLENRLRLNANRVVISGAGGAIGSAAARACAALGANLVLLDVRRPADLERELRSEGVMAVSYGLDNSSQTGVERLFQEIGPMDALIDASGYYAKGDWTFGHEDWEAIFDRTIAVNVRGPINLVRAALPVMRKVGKGRIVLTSSLAGRTGGSVNGLDPSYVASKGALQALVRFLARQCAADGIIINAVAPGPIVTPMMSDATLAFDVDAFPMKRFGTAEEVGWPLAFLCTTGATFITGAVVDVNGGIAFS